MASYYYNNRPDIKYDIRVSMSNNRNYSRYSYILNNYEKDFSTFYLSDTSDLRMQKFKEINEKYQEYKDNSNKPNSVYPEETG